MTHIQNRLVNYLKTYCYGKDNAVSKDRLAGIFDITTRELRDLKRDIVLLNDVDIGSTNKGYYFAETDEDLDLFGAYYKSRAIKEIIMWRAYRRIKKNKKQRQLSFDYTKSL